MVNHQWRFYFYLKILLHDAQFVEVAHKFIYIYRKTFVMNCLDSQLTRWELLVDYFNNYKRL